MNLGPGERERHRWAVLRLVGRCYPDGTPARVIHVDLLLAPVTTRRNIARSRWARERHGPGNCAVCDAILADPDTAITAEAQQKIFPAQRPLSA